MITNVSNENRPVNNAVVYVISQENVKFRLAVMFCLSIFKKKIRHISIQKNSDRDKQVSFSSFESLAGYLKIHNFWTTYFTRQVAQWVRANARQKVLVSRVLGNIHLYKRIPRVIAGVAR